MFSRTDSIVLLPVPASRPGGGGGCTGPAMAFLENPWGFFIIVGLGNIFDFFANLGDILLKN